MCLLFVIIVIIIVIANINVRQKTNFLGVLFFFHSLFSSLKKPHQEKKKAKKINIEIFSVCLSVHPSIHSIGKWVNKISTKTLIFPLGFMCRMVSVGQGARKKMNQSRKLRKLNKTKEFTNIKNSMLIYTWNCLYLLLLFFFSSSYLVPYIGFFFLCKMWSSLLTILYLRKWYYNTSPFEVLKDFPAKIKKNFFETKSLSRVKKTFLIVSSYLLTIYRWFLRNIFKAFLICFNVLIIFSWLRIW